MKHKSNKIITSSGYLCLVIVLFTTTLYGQKDLSRYKVQLSIFSIQHDEDIPKIDCVNDDSAIRDFEREFGKGIMPAGDDIVIAGPVDDRKIMLKLENLGETSVYFLAERNSQKPVGYVLFRPQGEINWRGRNPTYGREGSFTGGGVVWVELPPKKSIEFSITDLSTRVGEHTFSILLNSRPKHSGRRELMSDIYNL